MFKGVGMGEQVDDVVMMVVTLNLLEEKSTLSLTSVLPPIIPVPRDPDRRRSGGGEMGWAWT